MLRRILLLLAVLACAALAAAPSAQAQDPTIVTDITFPEDGAPFGTFTASDPLCPSGTFVDEFVGGGGQFRAVTIRKMFVCADGSGTFTIQFHPQIKKKTTADCGQSGPFAVIRRGTGAYTRLRGTGEFCVFDDADGIHETFTGRFRVR
jgi:hypothetical protein